MARFEDDILRDCTNAPISSIKQRIVLIKTEDLPHNGIVNEVINDISLNAGTTGYEIEGFYKTTFNAPETGENGFSHGLYGLRMYDPSGLGRKQINDMTCGTNVYAVVERNWKGIDKANSFLFFGLNFGLELSELVENDGAFTFSLSTPAGFQEPKIPAIYLDTDYATSLTAFNNKFAAA